MKIVQNQVPVKQLARALASVASAGDITESKAVTVIALVRGIPDLKAFDQAVRGAYKENGWNVSSGRPAAGNQKGTVPATVKQYVSLVRAAFRLKLPLATYRTFHAIRKAVKAKRTKQRKPAAKPNPMTEGVHVREGHRLTGAPFHDLVVLYDTLGNGKKQSLAQAVDKLVKQFQPGVQLVLAKAA